MKQAEQLVFVKEQRLDNDLLFILRDARGKNRIVDGKPYKDYRLQPGMSVEAIVRGRGCAGEEIAELQHPYYKTGFSYEMTIIETKTLKINNVSASLVIVIDKDNNFYRIRVESLSGFIVKQKVWCKLMEQKKGKLIFDINNTN